jgi:RecB family exonuclease
MRRPKKPTLTPSRLTTYLACPTKYRWAFVDARGQWYRKQRSAYSFGTSLHSVLERFHADADRGGVPTVEQTLAVMEESWIDEGYASPEEMEEAFGEGQAILERYVDEMRALPTVGKTLLLEQSLQLEFERFRLLGRVDRVCENEDGSLEIIDYKTGRLAVSEEDVKFDIQLGCYQLLVRAEFPGRVVRATLWALKSGERASYGFSEVEAAEFRDSLEGLGNEILSANLSLTPVKKRLCEGCEFLPLCSRQPGFGP